MNPIRAGGWNYNVNTGPPLDWDTSREAAKYFRVVKWISTVVDNPYSPNDKDPAEPVPTPVSSRALLLPLFFEIFGEDKESEPVRAPTAQGAGWAVESSSPASKRVAVWSGVKKFKAKCNLIDSRPIIYPSDRQRGGIAGGTNQGDVSGGHGGRGGRAGSGGRGGGYGGYVNRGGYSGEFGSGSGRGRGGIHQGGVL